MILEIPCQYHHDEHIQHHITSKKYSNHVNGNIAPKIVVCIVNWLRAFLQLIQGFSHLKSSDPNTSREIVMPSQRATVSHTVSNPNLIGYIISFPDNCWVHTNMLEITAHFILKINGVQVQIQILSREFSSCTTNIVNHFSSLFRNHDWMMGTNIALSMVSDLAYKIANFKLQAFYWKPALADAGRE